MKLILSLSSLALVFLISVLGLQNPVDYTGVYQNYNKNPRILKEELKLKDDFTFEYNFIIVDAVVSEKTIRGTYKISRKQLKLFPTSFGEEGKTDTRALSRFESGNNRLQPIYHLRQWKNQLSLCLQEVKRELLLPEFVKIEE